MVQKGTKVIVVHSFSTPWFIQGGRSFYNICLLKLQTFYSKQKLEVLTSGSD